MRVSPILVLLPLLLMAIPQVGALVAAEAETTAATPQPVDMKKTLLNSFEDDAVLATLGTRQARLALSDQHATAGHTSLEVVFGVADYPNVSLRAEKSLTVTDWRPYGALLFDAYSPDEKPLRVSVRIDDSTNHNWTTRVELPPRRQVRVALVLRLPKTGMRGYPMSAACQVDLSGYFWQTTFDLGNIASFQFFLDHPKQERTVFIDNLQLTEIPPLTNIVDRYGQFTRAEWPGKIHVDRDLIDCHEAEGKALCVAARPADRDAWGGWAEGPQLKASGWFRAEKRDGQWWLVTPGGRLFWSVGLDCVGPDASGPLKDQEELFSWRPEETDPLYAFGWKHGWVNFWGMNLYRTYGPNWEQPWLTLTRQRMVTWGFNTVGNWSPDKTCRELRLPFTIPVHYDRVEPFNGGDGDISDFFSARWAQVVEDRIIATTGKWNQDAFCIGYFIDNELPWGKADAFVSGVLGLTGERAAKREVTGWLRKKYDNIASLNKAWGTEARSWEQFQAQAVRWPGTRNAALETDMKELLSEFAQRYYATVAALMKKHAPHQLYLGSRFSAVPPDEVALASAKHCDVVSYNIYGRTDTLVSRGRQIALFDRPVLIGEFHFGALDRGMFHGGMVGVSSQEERGVQYAEYIQTALAQPWCVGAHWFTYGDEMLTGRGDGENFNIGFVSVADVPYPELVSRASEINAEIYRLRGRMAK